MTGNTTGSLTQAFPDNAACSTNMADTPPLTKSGGILTNPIDFYFDYSSPYGYIAALKIDDLAARYGRSVIWKPILLGAVFKVTGGKPLPTLPLKGDYSKIDIARSARFHNLPYKFPSKFPIAGQAPSRAFYWVNDQPLLDFLGVQPVRPRFRPLYFSHELLTSELEKVRQANEGKDKNRNGILLANPDCPQTKTLTHTMWSLYNLLPARSKQKAHRHNSIAMDFAVKATEGVYTMIGPDLDSDGNIVNPIRADWVAGGAFVTPPGWWHSHHNESDEDAIVLPVQDAGLQTYMQTLDIQFAHGY